MTLVDPLSSLARARASVLRTSTAERVADAVREEVVEGRLRPGARLPEQALCDVLGVSRNTVREALSQLVTERVLAREPNRGVFVARPDADAVATSTACVDSSNRPRYVTAKRGDRRRSRVCGRRSTRAGRRATGDWDGVASANQHFHRALVGLGGSPRLDQQMKLLLAEMRLVFHRMSEVRAFHEPYLDRNDAICVLLEAGERAAAADEVRRYLSDAESQILEAYARL